MNQATSDCGSVHIADEVIGIIAGLAAAEVEGVKGMAGGFAGGIAELLGKKNLSKGVKVDVGEKEVVIDIYLGLDYGTIIHYVAQKVQENVKKTIEGMTGLQVVEVNVHITAVDIPPRPKEETKEEVEDKKKEEKEEKQEKKTEKKKESKKSKKK